MFYILLNDAFYLFPAFRNIEILELGFYATLEFGIATLDEPFTTRGLPDLGNPRAFPNLTDLVLHHWEGDAQTLRHLLRGVGPRLSKLSIYQAAWHPNLDEVEIGEVLRALRPWRKSLRELSFRSPSPNRQGDIDELRHFEALQDLDIHTDAFRDPGPVWDDKAAFAACLPPSLRTLSMHEWNCSLAVPLSGVLDALRAGRLKELRKIEATGQSWDDEPTDSEEEENRLELQEQEQLKQEFEREGVAVVVHVIDMKETGSGGWDVAGNLWWQLEVELEED